MDLFLKVRWSFDLKKYEKEYWCIAASCMNLAHTKVTTFLQSQNNERVVAAGETLEETAPK